MTKKVKAKLKETTHTTHGAYTPISGPIISVGQLIRGKNQSDQTPGFYDTLEAYSSYIKSLSKADLDRHAIEHVKIVAIDDRNKLIRRLESEWSGIKFRESYGAATNHIPKKVVDAKQEKAMIDLRKKMLGY